MSCIPVYLEVPKRIFHLLFQVGSAMQRLAKKASGEQDKERQNILDKAAKSVAYQPSVISPPPEASVRTQQDVFNLQTTAPVVQQSVSSTTVQSPVTPKPVVQPVAQTVSKAPVVQTSTPTPATRPSTLTSVQKHSNPGTSTEFSSNKSPDHFPETRVKSCTCCNNTSYFCG